MLFNTIISSALLLASQALPAMANPMPEEKRTAMKLDYFNGITTELLKRHAEYDQKADEEDALAKRADLPWNPSRHWEDGGFGWHRFTMSRGCNTWSRRKYYYGYLVRMISFPSTNPNSNQRRNLIYYNSTDYYSDPVLPSGQTECHRWGSPVYAPGTQCVDKIKLSNGQYTEKTLANNNTGWYVSSAHGNKSVRDIWDCLLNRTAVEYRYTHPDVGKPVVQYQLEGSKYYRFYDDNNFAWFAFCGVNPNAKRQSQGKKNYNPIWDYMPPKYHNPLADKTDIYSFKSGIKNFHKPDSNSWSSTWLEDKRFSIYYFPPAQNHYVTIDGEQCGHIAVSRPGLRHWTVRLYYEEDPGYVQPEDEYVPTLEEYAEDGNY